jgi:hypothetical protein
MSWDGAVARAGLAELLTAAVEGTNVSVFPAPPSTFNPPALVVQYPQTVSKYTAGMGVDTATWAVMVAVGLENQSDYLDQLANLAADAIFGDPSLAGITLSSRVTELRNWRILLMSGVEVLTAEVVVESRM